jgi:hypothetical protein
MTTLARIVGSPPIIWFPDIVLGIMPGLIGIASATVPTTTAPS